MKTERECRRALETMEQVLAALRSEPEQDATLRALTAGIDHDRALLLGAMMSPRGVGSGRRVHAT
jgi:hypothetical protein